MGTAFFHSRHPRGIPDSLKYQSAERAERKGGGMRPELEAKEYEVGLDRRLINAVKGKPAPEKPQ